MQKIQFRIVIWRYFLYNKKNLKEGVTLWQIM